MRDLGLMGESTFSLLCAEVGLIPNGSQIDKTGWDFFVTLENSPQSSYRIQVHSYDLVDYNNGSYSLTINLEDYDIPAGIYTLNVRSPYNTKIWSVNLIAEYSWGPTVVFISLAVCIAFFIFLKIWKARK